MKYNKRIKKIIIYAITVIIILISLICAYLYIPKKLESIDNRLRDFMFTIRGDIPQTNNIVIIDINDRSLKEIGQWPWSRDILSQLLINLEESQVGVIALDIVFPETDRSNPEEILKKLAISTKKNIPNYDTIFAQTIAQTPTILGYQFLLSHKNNLNKESPNIPAIFIEKGKQDTDYVITAQGTILNLPIIQNSAYSSGFFNNIPDESGIIRTVPLIIRYNDQIFPSLALETLRAIMGIKKVYINYDKLGVNNITMGDFKIPTDRYGRIIINFRGKEKTFKYISASDILSGDFNQNELKNAIVFIGTSATGLHDLRATPVDSVFPGVEIHANVIDNILSEDFISKPYWIDGANIVHIAILVLLVVFIFTYLHIMLAVILFFTILSIDIYFIYFMLFEEGYILNILFPVLTITLSTIITIIINYFLEIKQTQSIKNKFSSKVSKEVMESLLEVSEKNKFTTTSKEITVFFSDIRNFTKISESSKNPQVLIDFLNEYMDPMSKIIIQEKGTIDKFIGDAIMAYWNAPLDIHDHANKAVVAAMEQLHQIDNLNKQIKQNKKFNDICTACLNEKIEPIQIGIGINTGTAIVGEMGSQQRSDYTIIGDPVNLGARLESLCKYYNSSCNISDTTKEQLDQNNYIFRFLDFVTVKGKSEPIKIWQVIDYNRKNSKDTLYKVSYEKLHEELNLFHEAIALYQKSNFTDALKIFSDIQSWENKTNKNIYNIYIQRCQHYIKEPPNNFDGVFIHTTKG